MQIFHENDTIKVKGSIRGEAGTNLGKVLLKETKPVRLDLAGVRFIDTLGIGVLVTVSAKFRNKGLSLEIQNCPESLQKVLKLTKITSLLRTV